MQPTHMWLWTGSDTASTMSIAEPGNAYLHKARASDMSHATRDPAVACGCAPHATRSAAVQRATYAAGKTPISAMLNPRSACGLPKPGWRGRAWEGDVS